MTRTIACIRPTSPQEFRTTQRALNSQNVRLNPANTESGSGFDSGRLHHCNKFEPPSATCRRFRLSNLQPTRKYVRPTSGFSGGERHRVRRRSASADCSLRCASSSFSYRTRSAIHARGGRVNRRSCAPSMLAMSTSMDFTCSSAWLSASASAAVARPEAMNSMKLSRGFAHG